MYNPLEMQHIERLKKIVGGDIIQDPEKMPDYAGDEFADPSIRKLPEVVVKPRNSGQISEILRLANHERIPVTPRGGGTGLSGGCVPFYGGIVLSLEKMTKILEVDKKNMMAVVEAGVTLRDFYPEIEKEGLFFPPHPGEESAQFGGLVNTNASGSRAVKYGGVRNYVRGLDVVLPQGDQTTIGGKYVKSSTGYDLLHLMIGSEGTLGVVTRVVLSLLPKPQAMCTLVVPYDSLHKAIETVPEIRRMNPMAVEFIEHDTIPPAESMLGKRWPCRAKAYLMIIVDGNSEEEVFANVKAIGDVCLRHGAAVESTDDLIIVDSPKKQRDILDIRSNIYSALKRGMIEILDIAVPPARIAEYVDEVHKISEKYGMWLPTYGHAADGNVHTHLMKVGILDGKLSATETEGWRERYLPARDELHEKAIELGGIVSGEHGIGLVKREYLHRFIDPVQLDLMRKIKRLYDPNNILNPGKIFPP